MFEQQTMNHLGLQNLAYPDIFEQGTATHVVTGVVYGAQAFFVFDYEVSSSETKQDVKGNLKAIIKKIPLISIEGEGDLNMNDKEKENVTKLSCKFYGDYALESNPVTYEDAIKIYATLPHLLGENGEKAVPVKVWLYPLQKLDSKAAQLVRNISIELVLEAEAALEELNEVNMTCKDMMNHPSTISFPEIKKKIMTFSDLCIQYKLTFQQQLANSLPAIRGGGEEEGVLMDILSRKGQSPFSTTQLQGFLDKMQQELAFVDSCLRALENVSVISSERELSKLMLDVMVEQVVSFNFTSLNEEEPYLQDLELWLQSQFQNKIHEKKEFKPWFSNREIIKKTRKSVKAFMDFLSINKSRESTQFIVASVSEQNNPGSSIYLYENGELVSTNFEPPAKPNPPLSGRIAHDSIELKLKPSDTGRDEVMNYRIEYRLAEQENWSTVDTNDKNETFTIKNLQPNSGYQVRCSAVCKAGMSLPSDNANIVKTLPTNPPGMPVKSHVEPFAISISWEIPTAIAEGLKITEYKVEYQAETGEGYQEGKDSWSENKTGTKNEQCTIEGLKPNTMYKIRVSAVCGDVGTSLPSEEIIVTTLKEGALRLSTFLERSTLEASGHPSLYLLNTVFDKSCRKFSLGENTYSHAHKTIMMIGATGTGKTTLINGMINYILGVEWKDDFRFKAINEVTGKTQAESQTSEVTAYEINYAEGFKIPYSLTIIDTPGFGDTRGLEQDKQIVEKIREFFSIPQGIDHLNAVCFVVQASLARLTHTQKYIFHSILSIFGHDIKDNIQVLVTFADGNTPPVLDAINKSEVPCLKDEKGVPHHFKFNNSALFVSNANSGNERFNFNEMFWEMGLASFEIFFSSLGQLKSTSLRLTKQVLEEREKLEVTIQGLQPLISQGLLNLEEIRMTQKALEQNRGDMEDSKDFQYEVEITVAVKEEIKDFITNCQTCHATCHHPCIYADDKDKVSCAAMDKTGHCTVCPGKCNWAVHYNQKYKWSYVVKKEKRTYSELKAKYEKAFGEVMSKEKILEKLTLQYDAVKERVLHFIDESSKCIQRLQEIALKPNPLSVPEHIDLLIQAEQQEKKPGFLERIASLTAVREQAVLITKIANKEELLPDESKKFRTMQQSKSAIIVKSLKDFWGFCTNKRNCRAR
ncbi:uncharacterized protein LOC115083907 [Rhinatrema bivittatum]|uniref:uncharacterized protein LOC115083907 n=1 Tax=Rhinatrema bivittatum TaxID=194408 RepID=UPI00112CB51B|nr:uncharacterized protein LOC115083907 [Rhinatrema bivittatum]